MQIPEFPHAVLKTEPIEQELTDFYSIQPSFMDSEIIPNHNHNSYEKDFHPILQQQLDKKTLNISWQNRFFSLTATRLLYYENQSKTQFKGCFNLASLKKYGLNIVRNYEKLILTVSIGGEERKQILILCFENKIESLEHWHNKIEQCLTKISPNNLFNSTIIPISKIESPYTKIYCQNYWNRITISTQEFHNYANQLDIVFFKSKAPITSFHRLLMRSNFDHVGLLVRDSLNRLMILEAIETRGVWINEWDKMVGHFKDYYQEISVRKLISTKNIDIEMLQNYLDQTIGKKYELSLSKLFIGDQQSECATSRSQKQNRDSNIEKTLSNKQKRNSIHLQENKSCKKAGKQKTFFCSELIADIYINCGLISGRKKNQFWPRDFESNEIKLVDGANLSPMMYLTH